MENITDALKMAGSVLLFVLALSITVLAYSQARESIDAILKYSDREYSRIEGDEDFYYLSNTNNTSRYVGKETIIPTLYRSYKENYKIVFKFPDDYYLFERSIRDRTDNNKYKIKKIFTIDLLEQSIANDQASREFLNGIVYGKYDDREEFEKKFQVKTNGDKCLNDKLDELNSYKIKETLGTFYVNDLKTIVSNDDSIPSNPNEIKEINKTEKRIITYTFE